MPKPLVEDVRPSIGAVTRAAKAHLRDPDSNAFPEFVTEHGLRSAQDYVGNGYFPVGTYSREQRQILEQFLDAALEDVRGLYRGARHFLLERDTPPEGILPIIQRSKLLGRQFGRLTNQGKYANNVAAKAFDERDTYFEMGENDEGEPLVNFAPAKLSELKGHMGSAIGCPLLSMYVQCPFSEDEKKVSVYELYWEAFTDIAHRELEQAPVHLERMDGPA